MLLALKVISLADFKYVFAGLIDDVREIYISSSFPNSGELLCPVLP